MSGIGLIFSAISAVGQLQAGQAAYEESLLTAFRTREVDKKLQKVEAQNAANARIQEASMLESSNIAALSATGRDLSGLTVKRILERDREVLGDDIKSIARRSLFMQLQSESVAMAEIRSGRNKRTASTIKALGTVVSGIENAAKTST